MLTHSNEEASVLLVAHTVLSLRYVQEHYLLLNDDRRLRFALTQGADDWGVGVGSMARRLPVPTVPWQDAVHGSWDLALFGTHGGAIYFDRTRSRVHVQHGLGAGKLVDGDDFTYGPSWALWNGRPKYDLMLEASHAVQRRAIAACPPLAGVIAVVGDLFADRLLAAQQYRTQHRAALGISDDDLAVILISTWGPDGLIGSMGTALLDSALALPRCRVVLTMHPHVWHGRVDGTPPRWGDRLAPLRKRGLIVCGPNDSWIPHLTAADVAVIDHGSLGLYWALLGRPTVAAPVPAGSTNPDSPIAKLRAVSMPLDPSDLHNTIARAMATHDPERNLRQVGEIVSYPGQSAARTRHILYQAVGLPPAP
jgi:hypothetical protein